MGGRMYDILIKYEHDIKMGETADMQKSRTRIENHLNEQEKWAEKFKVQ